MSVLVPTVFHVVFEVLRAVNSFLSGCVSILTSYSVRPVTLRRKMHEPLVFFAVACVESSTQDARELLFSTSNLTQNYSDFVPLHDPTDR